MGKYIWFDKIVLSTLQEVVQNKKPFPNGNGFFQENQYFTGLLFF